MTTREDLDRWIDRYSAAIQSRNPHNVVACYHPAAEITVHGLSEAGSAWNSKHTIGTEGIVDEYQRFFDLVGDFTVTYTDRILDSLNCSAAVIVRIAGTNKDGSTFDRANALHLTYDDHGLIASMRNWYGDAIERPTN